MGTRKTQRAAGKEGSAGRWTRTRLATTEPKNQKTV